MNYPAHRNATNRRAFAMIEALVILAVSAVVLVLIFWVLKSSWKKWRASSAMATCTANLKSMGEAMEMYSKDDSGRLPYAGLRTNNVHISWDDLLRSYLGSTLDKKELASPSPKERLKLLQCPADDLGLISDKYEKTGGHRRSYAMPSHNMAEGNWPPGPDNGTGIGILWDLSERSDFPDSKARWHVLPPGTLWEKGPSQPAFSMSSIPDPSKTIAITEHLHTNNVIGNVFAATIPNATEHIHIRFPLKAEDLHKGGINYLLLDGHVEHLSPLDTLGPSSPSPSIQSGMWTVTPND